MLIDSLFKWCVLVNNISEQYWTESVGVVHRFEDFRYLKRNGFNTFDVFFLIKMLVRSIYVMCLCF